MNRNSTILPLCQCRPGDRSPRADGSPGFCHWAWRLGLGVVLVLSLATGLLAQDPPATGPAAGDWQEVPSEVTALLTAVDQGRAAAVAAAREIAEHPNQPMLLPAATSALRAAYLEGQSDSWTENLVAVLEQWTPAAEDAGELLIRLLEDPRPAIRQAALEAAVHREAVANPRILPMIANLRYAAADERYRAANFLGKFGAQAAPAVGALVRAAQDESSHAAVRWEAVFALRDIGPAALPGLVEVLQTTDRSVAYKTLESIQTLGPEGAPAYEAVVTALASEDPHIRWRAASVLGRLPEQARQSLAHLEPLLDDPDQHVRDAAAESLKLLQETGVRPGVRPPPEFDPRD